MNSKRVFIQYPCGKKFEIRVPIIALDDDGNKITVLPGQDNYWICAKQKFQFNNLKVIEEEVYIKSMDEAIQFVSLAKKVHSIE